MGNPGFWAPVANPSTDADDYVGGGTPHAKNGERRPRRAGATKG